MDGNRRWAKERGLPTFDGHKQGGQVLAHSIEWVCEARIPHVVYYAFSTENWKRSKEEVSYLMDLFGEYLENLDSVFSEGAYKEKVRFQIIGRKRDFSEKLQKQMTELENKSAGFEDVTTTVWIALSYGGRAEIVEAVNKALKNGEEVTEATFAKLLSTSEMPDPDMIVRTSGEQRLSNFLTWKSVYSEFYFIKKHWPALTKSDFADILSEYERRERRQGA